MGPIIYGVTCDSCAQGGKTCTVEPETESYICEDCTAFHEVAIAAAADQVITFTPGIVEREFAIGLARVVVDAYLDHHRPRGCA